MFDLNQFVSAALNAAVAEAIKPLVERIAVLELRIDTLSSQHVAIGERLAALENNPAQGQDLTLMRDVAAEVNKVVDSEDFWHRIGNYVTEQVGNTVEAKIEEAMDNHLETYNHDDYDSVVSNWNDEDPADFLRESDLCDQIDDRLHETLRNATFSISI